MRARAVLLALLVAAGCASREPPAPAPTSPEAERETHIQQSTALVYQAHALRQDYQGGAVLRGAVRKQDAVESEAEQEPT